MPKEPNNVEALVATSGIPLKRICAACDISEGTLYNWRKERYSIPADKLPVLADALGVSIFDLMGWASPDTYVIDPQDLDDDDLEPAA